MRDPKELKFVDVYGMLPIYKHYWDSPNPPAIAWVGPKGIAKSLGAQAFGAAHGIPVITFGCNEDVRRGNLTGFYILRGNETQFVCGGLTTALEVANEANQGGAILVLEEANALTGGAQKVLNPLTDFNRRLDVPEARRVFELQPGKKLLTVLTANEGYGGTFDFNEDLRSRLRIFPLRYPTKEQERIIVNTAAAKLPAADIVEGILQLAQDTRASSNSFAYQLSPRDVVQLAEDAAIVGLKTALWGQSGKFPPSDRPTFEARVKAVFKKAAL